MHGKRERQISPFQRRQRGQERQRFISYPANDRGFTLLELMVSVFIISVLMAIAIPNLRGSGEKAQKAACESDQRLIRTALDSYWVENHSYPTGTTDEIVNTLVSDKYLQAKPKEPSGGQFSVIISNDTAQVSCSVHGELGDTDGVSPTTP
ncbi:prepilin-type N-terminal cleavage/methylation domain-containing protein [Fodinisporobacter ferrooxydans]|uniref:Prepilin-type N-terminal cleavage/methylation domain-containing protein n=1 Tax=Fodinisporobacter ferrooxydans TaxID=2901836 RepID=A0ABY4CLL5_9BACL|nr:prepilin-type N-terminal cleavage/methylation domain-containing protein [Alicyclobacillaceae bacterium MYW30-H2]